MTEPSYDEQCDLNERCEAFFKAHRDEYNRCERIKFGRRLSRRSDLNAFLLLDKLVPGGRNVIEYAKHNVIWLSVAPHELMLAASEEDLLDLIRCGVRYNSSLDGLFMFV